jgi:hypothetical protein
MVLGEPLVTSQASSGKHGSNSLKDSGVSSAGRDVSADK